jgi:hypothetical protein
MSNPEIPKEADKPSPQDFLRLLAQGLEEIVPDEAQRKLVLGWAQTKFSEMGAALIQQSAAISGLSAVLDDVLGRLRAWSWSTDKGWMRARSIITAVMKKFKTSVATPTPTQEVSEDAQSQGSSDKGPEDDEARPSSEGNLSGGAGEDVVLPQG